LYWNEFYGRYDTFDFGYGHEAFLEKGCAHSGCFATKDRTLLPIEQVNSDLDEEKLQRRQRLSRRHSLIVCIKNLFFVN
jgi:hypothetical protein